MPFTPITDGVKVEVIGFDASKATNTANVLHVFGAAGISVPALTDIANAVLNRLSFFLTAGLIGGSNFSYTEVVCTDINTVGGNQVVVPAVGLGGGGTGSPGGICSLVKLTTNTRSRRGRGRIFWGPIPDTSFTNDILSSGYISTMNTQMADLQTDLAALAAPTGLAVASRKDGLARLVTGFSCEPTVAYQRRRSAR